MNSKFLRFFGVIGIMASLCVIGFAADDSVKIGLNYPETGPYSKQGLDQKRAAMMAVEEINGAGGILGKKIELVYRDDKNNAKIAKENAIELYDKEGVEMVLGGSSSSVAIATGKIARQKKKLFFGTLTYSTETTGEEGHKFVFRECYDSGMAARVLATYLNKNFAGKKFFYISADYTWGWTTEEMFRKYTNTVNKDVHKGILTKLGTTDFTKVLKLAAEEKPDVLVLVLFGKDMEIAAKQAYDLGIKSSVKQIVVPNLTEDMAEGATPEAMEGIVGAVPWTWSLPIAKKYEKGISFVKNFEAKYNRYPTSSGGSAYTILYQYKNAVEKAGSFDSMAVIKVLEGLKYTSLKDEQQWRDWDHQSVQTVYAVVCKNAADVKKDKYQLDFFEIISEMNGADATIKKEDWILARNKVGAASSLEE